MNKKVYRTAIYARLSRDDGDKAESNSIISQKLFCREYIEQHSELELVDTFADDGQSGVSFDRPEFRRMEQAIRDGKIDCIVCRDLSRFSRNYIEAGRYLEKIFPQLNIRFIAINDSYDNANGNIQSDSFIVPFKNLINDTYCKDISVKIRSSLDVKRRKGEYVGAFTPYGYRKDENNRNQLVVDEYAGEIVRFIFTMYKDGISIGAIADRLNSMGVLSPMEYKRSQGSNFESVFKAHETALWSYLAVRRILTAQVYIGDLIQGKTGTPNYKVRKLMKKDPSEWIVVEAAHEPLISHSDFSAVQTMLARDRRACGDPENAGLFSGFLFCGDCGQSMVRKIVPSAKKKYVYYVCAASKTGGCSTHSISEAKLTKAVFHAIHDQIEIVLELEKALDYIDRLPSIDRKALTHEAQITKLEEEIERCQRLKLRLYEDLADGIIDKAEYSEFRESYTKAIAQKKEALSRVRREYKDTLANGITERNWVTLFREYENIDELNRRVLMALVDKIVIHENHVIEILYKYRDEYKHAKEYADSFDEERSAAM